MIGLGLAGASAFGVATSVGRAFAGTTSGPVEIVETEGAVHFRVAGIDRFVIDRRRFDGEALLSVTRDARLITVDLSDARYPGTSLPADMRFEIRTGLAGRTLDLTMALGDFRGRAGLEGWLAGVEPVRSILRLASPVCELPGQGRLRLSGTAQAEFSVDWRLRLAGERVVRTSGRQGRLEADSLLLWTPPRTSPSFFEQAPDRRTSLAFPRGVYRWPIVPAPTDSGWSFTSLDSPFDLARVETTNSGRVALVLEGLGEQDRLKVAPATQLNASNGEPFAIALKRPRYAVITSESGVETAIIAQYGAAASWLHVGDTSLLVGGEKSDSGSRFEMVTAGRSVRHLECLPPLSGTFLPLPDSSKVISEPVVAEPGARVRIVDSSAPVVGVSNGSDFSPGATHSTPKTLLADQPSDTLPANVTDDSTAQAIVQLTPREIDFPNILVTDPRLVVVRPDDLLVLTIVFKGMKLESTGGKTRLVRDGGGAAYLIVHFPPQNIAEEALWEAEDSYTDPKPKNSDPASGNSDNPANYPPPVGSRFAGPSRLVFTVPGSTSSINYSLESVLDAIRDFPLSVAPHGAEPGPEQPSPSRKMGKLADKGIIKSSGHILVGANVKVAADKLRAKPPKTRSTQGGGYNGVTSYRDTIGHLLQAASLQRELKSDIRVSKKGYEIATSPIGIDAVITAAVKPKIAKPTATQTAIESPFRLIITPNRYGSWNHVLEPVLGASGRVELWHTRLGVRTATGIDPTDPRYMTIRAIWARDKKTFENNNVDIQNQNLPGLQHENEPFRMSMDYYDRWNIVHLTSNWRMPAPNVQGSNASYVPRPVDVNLLMLSSLGSWMDTRGAWTNMPQGLSVEEWKQIGTMGRDHFVKVVYAGFLFPFGHRASLVKITERKIYYGSNGPIAYMFQRMFIIVREFEKVFRNLGVQVTNLPPGKQVTGMETTDPRKVDNEFPFRRVTITTRITPNLDKPEMADVMNMKQSCFWPQVGSKDFNFGIVAEDVDGKEVELTMPLAFVDKMVTDQNSGRTTILELTSKYEKEQKVKGADPGDPVARRRRPMAGQKIVYANYAKPGDTTFETTEMAFGAEVPEVGVYNSLSWQNPRFFPVMRAARLHIPSIKHLAGTEPQEFGYSNVFSRVAFGAENAGELLFDIIEGKKLEMDFSKKGDRSGALATPNMSIKGLARAMGPVGGDTGKIAGGNFDPTDFFGDLLSDLSPKLFGCINLFDIINGIAGGDLLNKLDIVPKFVTEALDGVEKFLALVEQMQATAERLKSITDPNVAQVPTNEIKNRLQAVLDPAIAIIGPDGDIAHLFEEPFEPSAIDAKLGTLQGHISDLSAALGNLMSGLEAPAPGVAEGEIKFFRDALRDVQGVLGDINGFLDKVRQFIGLIPTELPEELTLKFEWKPELKDWGFAPGKPLFIAKDAGKKATFVIGVEARIKTDLDSPPKVSVYTSLENFAVDLIAPLSFIVLHFEKIQFIADTGLKADVDVKLRDLEFVGPLSFVETLKDLIPLDGFSDPPAVDVSAEGIKASFSIPIPSVSVGVFSMKNISFSAGFHIPFIGPPLSVTFAFCTKENPFILTVMMFGGGGFFGITLDPAGIQSMEAAFEFGASLSVDFGVASGGVEVMAGVYFKMTLTNGEESLLLNGYLRIKGYVDVLGLISCTIILKMELIYESSSGKCIGRATLIIEIEVLIFSGSVEVSCEKKFAGANGDPTFVEAMGPAQIAAPTPNDPAHKIEVFPWQEYCQAFA